MTGDSGVTADFEVDFERKSLTDRMEFTLTIANTSKIKCLIK